ncbi:MAG: hypothetical protein ACT4PQ_11490 [Betaproteobacteria bacterium]
MMLSHVSAVGLFALTSIWVAQAAAHPLTLAECAEGGEFIRNAALARDAGASREFFVSKLEEDLLLIQAFPPQLRWFVQDAVDEAFLSRRVEKVFDMPLKPEQHEAAFISDCIQTTALAEENDV